MSNALVFRDPKAGPLLKQGTSDLAKTINTGFGIRRIQTNTNGTFKRFINGEQVGRAIRGSFNAIIVGFLPKVSRTYYEAAYDPNATPTLPDCWSNLGDFPEEGASNPQHKSCVGCPNDIKGSGDNGKGKACRYNRRIAILLEGDDSGEVYQLNVPAMSLFGKGNGNVHPFESYLQYLVFNKTSPDYVVTTIEYNLDADTMQLEFSPMRPITDEEEQLVIAAQCDPETQRYTQLTVAAASGVTDEPAPKAAAAPAAKPKTRSAAGQALAEAAAAAAAAEDDEPEEEQEEEQEEVALDPEPVAIPPKTRRKARAPVAEPEVAAKVAKAKPAPAAAPKGGSAFDAAGDDEEEEEEEQAPAPAPAARRTPTRKSAAAAPAKAAPAPKGELADIISSWGSATDDDDEAEAAE